MSKVIAIISILFIIYLLIFLDSAQRYKDKQKFNKYCDTNDKYMRSYDTKSVKKLEDVIEDMQAVYQETKDALPAATRRRHESDIEELQYRVNELEMERWEKKALPHLEKFWDCWDEFTCGDIEASNAIELFKGSEYYIKLQKKCVNAWLRYYALPTDCYEITIRPKEYFRDFMGEWYEPCMDSQAALEKRLAEIVAPMKPEYQRKNKLLRTLTTYVKEHENIQRSKLLKVDFPGFTNQEVRYGYKELIKKNRLVEVKIGDRYFVSPPLNKSKERKEEEKS